MLPTLPQNDPHPDRRKLERRIRYSQYRWAYEYPPGVAVVDKVPTAQQFRARYASKVWRVTTRLLANVRFVSLVNRAGAQTGGGSQAVANAYRVANSGLFGDTGAHLIGGGRPRSLQDYVSLYGILGKPDITSMFTRDLVERDRLFAWQRIAGCNPTLLRRLLPTDAPPYPVDDATFVKVVQRFLPKRDHNERPYGQPIPQTLAEAIGQGLVYVLDHRALTPIAGPNTRSVPTKYMFAPVSLYLWLRPWMTRPGQLVPLAVRCGQDPALAVFFPTDDPMFWEMAKTTVQVADASYHEMVAHLGHAHMVMEAIIIAAERELAPVHPLKILLAPHFEYTLALNDTAAKALIAKGGQVEQMMGGPLEESLLILKDALAAFELDTFTPARDIDARNMGNTDLLPVYPYRDDALPIWDALERYVAGYVRLYYSSDRAVQEDEEVQAWKRGIVAPADPAAPNHGGGLKGSEQVDGIDALVHLVTLSIFTGSVWHAAVNFPQFPLMSFPANMPGAAYADAPNRDTVAIRSTVGAKDVPIQPEQWLAMLPPMDRALLQINVLYELSAVRENRLGYYPRLHFLDARVQPLIDQLQARLAIIEAEIEGRNRTRFLEYPYLLPSRIPASIHI
jgi:arachidonate 15-lipoxygenase